MSYFFEHSVFLYLFFVYLVDSTVVVFIDYHCIPNGKAIKKTQTRSREGTDGREKIGVRKRSTIGDPYGY